MDDLSARFLGSFNHIEDHLRRLCNAGPQQSFVKLVRSARGSDPAIRHFGDDLREFAELRNAITHQYDGESVIATPHEETVRQIERIRERLLDPPQLGSGHQASVVRCSPGDMVSEVAMTMRERDFSQLPVYDETRLVGLLTVQAIARWVAAQLERHSGIMEDARVADVLEHTDPYDEYGLLPRTATPFDALEYFDRVHRRGCALMAIVITHNGKATEKPLGVITVYDVPELYNAVDPGSE